METFGISISVCFVYLTENLQYGDCQSGEAMITRHKKPPFEWNKPTDFHSKRHLHQPIRTFSLQLSPQDGSIYKDLINKHY